MCIKIADGLLPPVTEDDTIFLSRRRTSSDAHFRLMRQHRAVDFLGTFAIMYLTGQPEGECRSPDPAKVNTKL